MSRATRSKVKHLRGGQGRTDDDIQYDVIALALVAACGLLAWLLVAVVEEGMSQ